MYGNNVSIAIGSMPTTFTMTKDLATYPAVSPETEYTTNVTFTISADTQNGTIVYDVDGKQVYPDVKDFSSIAAVAALLSTKGEFVRVAARYQDNGTLVAVRICVSPEGHVRHVDITNDIITVDNEDGLPVQLQVTPTTTVFYRQPWNSPADAQPISMDGQTFLADGNLVRGFKIHASCVDPLAKPLVAQSIDIEAGQHRRRLPVVVLHVPDARHHGRLLGDHRFCQRDERGRELRWLRSRARAHSSMRCRARRGRMVAPGR